MEYTKTAIDFIAKMLSEKEKEIYSQRIVCIRVKNHTDEAILDIMEKRLRVLQKINKYYKHDNQLRQQARKGKVRGLF